jgi:hypothetical protein
MAVVPVIVIGSHGFSDRTVARNVCMFVCGTSSNVHVVAPLVGAGALGSTGLGWIVMVPRHVPDKND